MKYSYEREISGQHAPRVFLSLFYIFITDRSLNFFFPLFIYFLLSIHIFFSIILLPKNKNFKN